MNDLPEPFSAKSVLENYTEDCAQIAKDRISRYGFKSTHNWVRPFLTPKELSDQLSKSLRTLARWRKLGVGPPFKRIGLPLIQYPIPALDAWMDTQLPTQPPETD